MIAEIICVGTELLMGQVVNSDFQHIAREIAPLGCRVLYQVTVGDNPERLTGVVKTALSRSDIVILTGGLGPTQDDLTKETVARALGLTLVPFPEELERLRRFFASRGRTMAPINEKQAYFPQDAVILPNDFGTAPGCIMEADGKAAILLPGPPRELFPMFDRYAMPYLERRSGSRLYSRIIRTFGIGESDLVTRIRDILDAQTNPTVAPYIETNEVMLRVTALCRDDDEGERLVAPVVGQICARLGDLVYARCGETLPAVAVRLLREGGHTVGILECGTGGTLTMLLTGAAGGQDVLCESRILPPSGDDAAALAKRIRTETGAGIGMAVTADGDTASIAVTDGERAMSRTVTLFGEAARRRNAASLHALDVLRRMIG